MASVQRIESIKKWTPLVATVVVVIFSLFVFFGVIDFVMKFLGAGSYFSVELPDDSLSINSVKERNSKMAEFLKEREQKRQEASTSRTLNVGEKDPFNLP